jgi:hypothetical protein
VADEVRADRDRPIEGYDFYESVGGFVGCGAHCLTRCRW